MTGAERGRILFEAARLLRQNLEEIARLETIDTGKPIRESLDVDVFSAAEAIEYFAGVAPTLHGSYYDLGANFAYTRREALGVCAGLGAWNYPLQGAAWKSAPALACGNAMIFKPSEMTPLTAAKLAEIYTQAGVPNGVFNVVQGDEKVGKWLTKAQGIAKISLTGEAETGKKVMRAAADTLKHITLELGGKSPLIIFADADMDNAVSGAILGNFYTQGEVCSNATRVFVEKKSLNLFLDRLVERSAKIIIGDPLNHETQMGALISEQHFNKVMSYIKKGKNEGALLFHGGDRVHVDSCPGGYFVQPTIFTDCTDEMTIVKEEIFGPVMAVLPFESEEEAIMRANNTIYGLSAGVFTKDITRAHRVIAQLQAGTCWINTYNIAPVEIPFGGYKESGIGRENSLAAINHYTQLKTVYVETKDVDAPY